MMLAGKTVMVTGVGSGLGRECVTSALREGANVVMAARTKETLETTATELDPSGARVEAVPTDITDADDCAALVARATERFGSLDALIQVAAFEYVFGGLQDTNLDDWRTAFETNVLGALTVLRPVARSMQESGGGAVVLIGSQSMFKPSLPQAGYAASKGALLSTMYYLADELGAHNIRCNMVVPSWMWGPAVQAFVADVLAMGTPTPRHRPGSYAWPEQRQAAETIWSDGGTYHDGEAAVLAYFARPSPAMPTTVCATS